MNAGGLTSGAVQAESLGARPAPTLHWLGLGAIALAAQVALIYGLASTSSGKSWLPFLLPVAHLLLLPFLLRNLSFWGIRLILVGLLLNLAAMLANGGLMPVESSAVEAVGRYQPAELKSGEHIPRSKNVLVDAKAIHLRALSDVLVLPVRRPFRAAVSLGDLLVLVGAVIAYVEVARRRGVPMEIANE